ncbi:hypothetical protein Tco_1292768 [Tanacetum coccineum]
MEIVQEFKHSLAGIFSRRIHRVHVLDFKGMTEEMGMDIDARLSMRHRNTKGLVVFTSHAWRRLFDIRGPLVRELMLELFSMCRFDDLVLDLDADGIKDPLRRLCHRLIAHTIAGRGQALKKNAKGRKRGDQMSGGYFISRLVDYFRLLTEESLQGTTVVVATADAPEGAEGPHAKEEGNQAVLAPVQAPQPPLTDMTLLQRLARIEDEVHELRQSIVVAPIRPLTTLLSVAHKCHTRGRPNRGLVRHQIHKERVNSREEE